MNELERLIFDDLILCFFGRDPDAESSFWRNYFLNGDEGFIGYKIAFPENEICYTSSLGFFNYNCIA